jgi:hypothetical protein
VSYVTLGAARLSPGYVFDSKMQRVAQQHEHWRWLLLHEIDGTLFSFAAWVVSTGELRKA